MKLFLLGVLTVVLVQVTGAVIVVMMGLIPANADARPSRLEARLAGLVREAYVTRAVQTTDVTVNPTEANLSEGTGDRKARTGLSAVRSIRQRPPLLTREPTSLMRSSTGRSSMASAGRACRRSAARRWIGRGRSWGR